MTSLFGYTEYVVFGKLCSHTSCGPFSNVINFTTGETIPSCSPTITTLYNTSSTSLYVSWTQLPRDCSNGIITHYNLTVTDRHDVKFYVVTSNTSAHVTDLGKYEVVCVQVSGYTRVGGSNNSKEECIYTDVHPIESVPLVHDISVFPTSLKISLSPTDKFKINGILTHILLFYQEVSISYFVFSLID